MRRRDALVTLAAVTTTGCLGGVRSTLGLDEDDPAKPVEPAKPLGQYDCPTFESFGFDAVKRTICYREDDDGPKAINYTASKREAHPPPDLVELTIKRVGSGAAFYVISGGLVTRLTDEGWRLVAPTNGSSADEANPVALRSGESYTWTVGIGGDEPDESPGDGPLRLGDVGPGIYAFRARGRLDDGITGPQDIDVAHAMLFAVRKSGSS
ncbi:hypothetical protein C448_10112 [Halococcus morrhuae DSM 1307]|uniref:Lipoprotein n=1 Tax=Halococcus morrhuae DSM 1307 TaxID=931277 RepID=M0MF03_HALMO|nr:hypothetical protein [Halococcus morrhuae]EMA42985.1 hypothetical protein C448_10112 [Halococcus morrhuae DSM 1307]